MRVEQMAGAAPALGKTAAAEAVTEEQSFKASLSKAQAAATQPADGAERSLAAEDKKLRTACRELEAVFINMMLSTMRSTVAEGGLVEKSSGEKMMQSMLDREMAGNMAKAGGIGLGELLYRQMAAKVTTPGVETKKS